jgi:hypothetical protein
LTNGILVHMKNRPFDTEAMQAEDGFVVERQIFIMVGTCYPAEVLIQETLKTLANIARQHAITLRLDSIADHTSNEFSSALSDVKMYMARLMDETVRSSPSFVDAMKQVFGSTWNERGVPWILIAHWFENDNTAMRFSKDQAWCVD